MPSIRAAIRPCAVAVSFVLAVSLAGCGRTADVGSSPAPSPQVQAALAKADGIDGTVDKTVKKCFACNLGMDGKGEILSKVGEYIVNFCSEGCKKAFDKDPAAMILAKTAESKPAEKK